MKLWSGANFWHQFRARPWKWPAQVLGRVSYCGLMGLMGRSSNAHNFLNFPMECFEIFTICRRPPVLQTDASVGMMKIVVRETEARKASGLRTSTPR